MAQATCAKPGCGSIRFEMRTLQPPISERHSFEAVQCERCGTVVGVLEHNNIGALVGSITKELLAALATLHSDLDSMRQRLAKLEKS